MIGYVYNRILLNENDINALINSDQFSQQKIRFILGENFETTINGTKVFTHVILKRDFKGTIYEVKVVKIKGIEHYPESIRRIRCELTLEEFFQAIGIAQKPTSTQILQP